MNYNLQRSTHFNQSAEINAIRSDMAHGAYNGFRNTFDEWETRRARSADAVETDEAAGEDELERDRRAR